MRHFFAFILVVCSAHLAMAVNKGRAQVDTRAPRRFVILHADPWAVKAMLEGTQINQPELSTVGAIPRQQARQSPLLEGGYLVVNPTDNSLWWYPNRQ